MKYGRSALIGAVLCCIGAQGAFAATRSVQLSKVVLDPKIPAASQHIKVGTICLFSSKPLDFGASERTINYERFERPFSAVMQKRGFNAIAKSSNLFDDGDNATKPDFLIGATLNPKSIDICDSINGIKGTVVVSVEWQIYDRTRQEVVEKLITRGTGQLEKFANDGLTKMIDDGFAASLTALIDQGVLEKYLGPPAP